MNARLLHLAAVNNAEWCGAVAASYGITSSFSNNLWVNAEYSLKNYPNFVTLTPEQDNLKRINELSGKIIGTSSVKDSFDCLNLQSIGYDKLFNAQWLEAEIISEMPSSSGLEWKKVSTANKLMAWNLAWSNNESSSFFRETLLGNGSVRFIAAYEGKNSIAGAILYASDEAIGISNVFYPKTDPFFFWRSLQYIAQQEFPNKTVVGYEQGEELKDAIKAGLKPIGPLSVWSLGR